MLAQRQPEREAEDSDTDTDDSDTIDTAAGRQLQGVQAAR